MWNDELGERMEFFGLRRRLEQLYGARQLQPSNLNLMGKNLEGQLQVLKLVNASAEVPQGVLKARLQPQQQFGDARET